VVVSLKSAEGIYSFIDKEKFNLYVVILKKGDWSVRLTDGGSAPINKNDFSFVENGQVVRFDFAYITIHGTPGENGLLQGYFDLIGMPYSCCGVLAASITFNKFVCNNYLKSFGVNVADSVRLFKGEAWSDQAIVEYLGLPVFVKPNDGGSSFGVTKVKEIAELNGAIAKAFEEGRKY
jgi:D-alanine--D-alanine ligase (EC 6.3.2.4)